MNLIKSFLCFSGKSSGYVYLVRYLIIVFLFLLPTAIIIPPPLLPDISNISTEILPVIQLVFPFVIILFLIQDFQRMNALILNRKVKLFLFGVFTISYLLNYLSLWDEMFYFEISGYFNWALFLWLVFWNAKYDTEEEKRSAKKIFKK
tara:strand:- start:1840 stop:2283 length:444 start_codon:yes stop_codon:yes gene_type:complete